MISFSTRGSFENTEAMLRRIANGDFYKSLERYGQMGVDALSSATPVDSGETANSWTFEVTRGRYPGIKWSNTNVRDGVSIAILLQYGHGTGTGGYVQGRDYINPAIKPIFDQIADAVWREVIRA